MKKNLAKFVLTVYVLSTAISYAVIPKAEMGEGLAAVFAEKKTEMNPTNFGIMCISAVYPNIDIKPVKAQSGTQKGGITQAGIGQTGTQESRTKETGKESGSTEKPDVEVVVNDSDKDTKPRVFGKDPVVLIVHTHATESYLPSSEGNYHRKGRLNTVRDAGDVLAETLDKEGIPCVHDSTLHDEKSYNQAYSRSYETTEALLKKYPSIECVIDLHRDAVPGKVSVATVSIGGKKCAKYSYVVSNAVETYASNLSFVRKMNETATKNYDGFTGNILERGYRYNQNLSSKYMLLEIGYNRNDIEEVRNTAEYFGKILAETLKKGN